MAVPPPARNLVNYLRRFREITPGIGLPVDFTYMTRSRPSVPAVALHVLYRDGEWVPVKLELDAPPEEALTTAGVRVPLGRLMEEALLAAARPLTFEPYDEHGRFRGNYESEPNAVRVVERLLPDGKRQIVDTDAWLLADTPPPGELAGKWQSMTADELVAAVQEIHARPVRLRDLGAPDREKVRDEAARRRRQPIPMSDGELRAVAERYRTLVATGQRNPTRQIADERYASRMTASRWLRRARDLGYLEEVRSRSER